MIKILVISRNYPNSVQISKGIFVSEQVKFLAKKSETKVVSPVAYAPPIKFFSKWYALKKIQRKEIYENIEVFHPRFLLFPKKILYKFTGIFLYFGIKKTIQRIKKDWDFDIIHVHFSFPDGYAAMRIAKELDVLLVTTEHLGSFDLMMKHNFWNKITAQVFTQSKKVFVVSNPLRELILSLGIDSDKIQVMSNGVDLEKFSLSEEKKDKTFQLISIGNFVSVKGFIILLNSIKKLIQKGNDVKLTLIGDGILKKEYEDFIANNNLSEYVKLTGYITNTEIAEYIKKSHIYVSSSLKESFGVTIIEALACGIPVVATDCDGPSSIVDDSVGIIVKKNSVDSLVEGIDSVIENYESFSKKDIREYCRNRYDIKKIANEINENYKRVLNEKK